MGDEEAQKSPETAEPFNWKGYCLLPCGGLFALVVFVMGISFLTYEEDEPEPSGEMASYHCRDMVRENLRDPSSAEFSDETIEGHGTYAINGTVRATNGFGGTVAHDYECDVEWEASDDSYYVTMRIF